MEWERDRDTDWDLERERGREREREGDREKEILFPYVSFKEHAANSANLSEPGDGKSLKFIHLNLQSGCV